MQTHRKSYLAINALDERPLRLLIGQRLTQAIAAAAGYGCLALETRIVQAETELRFIKWFGGAVGLGTIGLIIERIAGVL